MTTITDLSLLDRLIDENPKSTSESVRQADEWLDMLRASVERDIENLLNTRSWLGTWPRELDLLRFSLLNCGLPDLSGVAIDRKYEQTVIRQTVQMALETFEPRLTNINVIVSSSPGDRQARILISAQLRGASEHVLFRRGLRSAKLRNLTKDSE
jgi:type VI secretion system protein ImpF